jgi:hypothetical protein
VPTDAIHREFARQFLRQKAGRRADKTQAEHRVRLDDKADFRKVVDGFGEAAWRKTQRRRQIRRRNGMPVPSPKR